MPLALPDVAVALLCCVYTCKCEYVFSPPFSWYFHLVNFVIASFPFCFPEVINKDPILELQYFYFHLDSLIFFQESKGLKRPHQLRLPRRCQWSFTPGPRV